MSECEFRVISRLCSHTIPLWDTKQRANKHTRQMNKDIWDELKLNSGAKQRKYYINTSPDKDPKCYTRELQAPHSTSIYKQKAENIGTCGENFIKNEPHSVSRVENIPKLKYFTQRSSPTRSKLKLQNWCDYICRDSTLSHLQDLKKHFKKKLHPRTKLFEIKAPVFSSIEKDKLTPMRLQTRNIYAFNNMYTENVLNRQVSLHDPSRNTQNKINIK
ncbi:unnamed protein product [Moneuplotes crassus]|uniref:Uncharacterized protein n=1 Tax=Euplotes crassus TaxID=5936 RepID=A0AAD1XFP1_EUPCR|nr:unnamed protein product [Moneuplotes crassus]